jgi:hypothetical protein
MCVSIQGQEVVRFDVALPLYTVTSHCTAIPSVEETLIALLS